MNAIKNTANVLICGGANVLISEPRLVCMVCSVLVVCVCVWCCVWGVYVFVWGYV